MAGEARRSTAAQFFMEEDAASADLVSTYDKVVELLNEASLIQMRETQKINKLKQVQQLIIHKDPTLLDNFLDEMLAFHSDKSIEIKRFMIGFMEEACKADPEILPKIVTILNMMLIDENIPIQKRTMLCLAHLHVVCLKWIAKTRKASDSMREVWEIMNGLKARIMASIESDNDGIRTHALKYMEGIALLLTRKLADDETNKRTEFSLDEIPEDQTFFKVKKLEEEGRQIVDTLLQYMASPHISSINLMVVMSALTTIAKLRQGYFSRVVQAFEALHVNLPPTLATSQVSSVRKNLKMQMLTLLRISTSMEYVSQITTLLTDLGATQSEVMKAMPKIDESKKRKNTDDEPRSSKKLKTVAEVVAEADDDDVGMTPFVGRPEKKPTADQRTTAIDITAEDILPRFTSENVADLVLISMVMLPDTMPPHFQATYTPIAAAGTEAQIKHMSRLLATQLTSAGMGKGIAEIQRRDSLEKELAELQEELEAAKQELAGVKMQRDLYLKQRDQVRQCIMTNERHHQTVLADLLCDSSADQLLSPSLVNSETQATQSESTLCPSTVARRPSTTTTSTTPSSSSAVCVTPGMKSAVNTEGRAYSMLEACARSCGLDPKPPIPSPIDKRRLKSTYPSSMARNPSTTSTTPSSSSAVCVNPSIKSDVNTEGGTYSMLEACARSCGLDPKPLIRSLNDKRLLKSTFVPVVARLQSATSTTPSSSSTVCVNPSIKTEDVEYSTLEACARSCGLDPKLPVRSTNGKRRRKSKHPSSVARNPSTATTSIPSSSSAVCVTPSVKSALSTEGGTYSMLEACARSCGLDPKLPISSMSDKRCHKSKHPSSVAQHPSTTTTSTPSSSSAVSVTPSVKSALSTEGGTYSMLEACARSCGLDPKLPIRSTSEKRRRKSKHPSALTQHPSTTATSTAPSSSSAVYVTPSVKSAVNIGSEGRMYRKFEACARNTPVNSDTPTSQSKSAYPSAVAQHPSTRARTSTNPNSPAVYVTPDIKSAVNEKGMMYVVLESSARRCGLDPSPLIRSPMDTRRLKLLEQRWLQVDIPSCKEVLILSDAIFRSIDVSAVRPNSAVISFGGMSVGDLLGILFKAASCGIRTNCLVLCAGVNDILSENVSYALDDLKHVVSVAKHLSPRVVLCTAYKAGWKIKKRRPGKWILETTFDQGMASYNEGVRQIAASHTQVAVLDLQMIFAERTGRNENQPGWYLSDALKPNINGITAIEICLKQLLAGQEVVPPETTDKRLFHNCSPQALADERRRRCELQRRNCPNSWNQGVANNHLTGSNARGFISEADA